MFADIKYHQVFSSVTIWRSASASTAVHVYSVQLLLILLYV